MLTVFRQNALTLDAVYDYDPLSGSYAFSPIKGVSGGGNVENSRHSTSLSRPRPLRAAALWQFGGYAQNNASNGAYQFQIGADIPISVESHLIKLKLNGAVVTVNSRPPRESTRAEASSLEASHAKHAKSVLRFLGSRDREHR